MNSKGSLLITTLWAMTLFSIMTTSLAFGASQHVLMMKREIQNFKDHADFMSVFAEACSKLESDFYPHEDSIYDSWYGVLQLPESFSNHMTASMSDEESKININEASERFLKEFFKNIEEESIPLKGSAKDYIKEVIALRSHKHIQSIEELLLMENFKEEDFEILTSFFTVYSETSLININTAVPLILRSLIEAIPADHSAKLLLAGRLREGCGAENRCTFLSRELAPDIFMEKLRLPRTPVMTSLVQEFLLKVTADSQTFHLCMKIELKKEADVIFRFAAGQLRPEVFSWHEI